MLYTVTFPDGVTSYIDSTGHSVNRADSETGTVEVEASRLTEYLAAGFSLIPSGMASLLLDLWVLQKAMSGDLVFEVSPATVAPAPTAAAWTRTVTVTLKTSTGEVHTWFDGVLASGVSIADTSNAGTATIPSTTLTFVNGVATVVVSGGAAAWLAAETDTLTVEEATILGYTVAEATSVETFTA
jgi:hypothetical protein